MLDTIFKQYSLAAPISFFVLDSDLQAMLAILHRTVTQTYRMPLLQNKTDVKLEAQWAEPVSLTFNSVFRKLNTELSICASSQISVHLATMFTDQK